MAMTPEKLLGNDKRTRSNGRLVLGYSQVVVMMIMAFLFGVVLHSQFQTPCRVWHNDMTTWSGRDYTRNTITALLTSSSSSKTLKEAEKLMTKKPKRSDDKLMEDSPGPVQDNHNGPWPRIAWLMSFPNSGTSYTLKMIHYLTDRAIATNYGDRHRHARTGKSVSVHPNSETGPFWTEPEEKYDSKRPSTYVLTKTHCGGSCALCGPYRYIETPLSFLEQCESGLRGTVDSKGKHKVQDVRYDAQTVVAKAIHLIRHPLDNVVSRFHLEWNEYHKHSSNNATSDSMPWIRKEFATDFERNPSGFRLFCTTMDKRYESQFTKSKYVNDDMIQMIKHVPCYGDLMRWIQWHNLALWTTRELQLPTNVLYYENYDKRFNDTVDDLLDFLQLPPLGTLVPFIAGKSYAETYFTKEERQVVKVAMQKLAYRDTWKLIEHYF